IHETIGTASDPIDKAREELLMQMKKGSKYREEVPKSLLPADSPARKEAGDYFVAVIELVDVIDAKPSGTALIAETAEKSGIAAAEAQFKALQQSNPKGYTFFEWDLNREGYMALEAKKYELALVFFTMNTTLYPNSANTYDSLGDGYAAKGDKEKARSSYQKAVQLNPKFTSSQEKLEKL
ncbi:MAG: tetratricopeptide repeat protein, partial [Bacteroidetes bacterium]